MILDLSVFFPDKSLISPSPFSSDLLLGPFHIPSSPTCYQISFGVAPATAAFALGLRSPLDTLGLAFFVLCGLTRLARFNVTVSALPKDATGKSKYFEGTPIPTSLAIVGAMAACVASGSVLDQVPGGVWSAGQAWEWHPATAVWMVWGCMMVSKSIRIPKL